MKTLLKKSLLLSMLVFAVALASCDNDDWRLEKEIIGSWNWYYEDGKKSEEIIYSFTPDGKWTYLYIYSDKYGYYETDVDGGYYNIFYGKLQLSSNFYNEDYTYDVDIHGRRMYLWDGEYEYELERIR